MVLAPIGPLGTSRRSDNAQSSGCNPMARPEQDCHLCRMDAGGRHFYLCLVSLLDHPGLLWLPLLCDFRYSRVKLPFTLRRVPLGPTIRLLEQKDTFRMRHATDLTLKAAAKDPKCHLDCRALLLGVSSRRTRRARFCKCLAHGRPRCSCRHAFVPGDSCRKRSCINAGFNK